MLTNPKWLDASRLAPQFYKHPVSNPPAKAVCLHNLTKGATTEQVIAAGVTHVWLNTKEQGKLSDKIHTCVLYSTGDFGSQNPTEEKVRDVARGQVLSDNMLITDEFNEGSYGQLGTPTAEWFYDELRKRAEKEKKNVQFFGEYGSGAINVYNQFRRKWDSPRKPMDPYFLGLLGPDIVDKLDADDLGLQLKDYARGRSRYMGRCVCYYYSFRQKVSDWILTIPMQAIYHYNAVPKQEVMLFTWPKMESHGVLLDAAQRESGTIRPDGTIGIDFPNLPPEISKMHAFFGCLFFEAVYLWNDYGMKDDDDNQYNGTSIATDAFFAGIHWYCELVPTIKEAGGDVVCCDYSANGKKFVYTGKERRVSRKDKPYYYNQYFNEVADVNRGFALCIPGKRPSFIYVNPYRSPLQTEVVTVQFGNRTWDLGRIPGMTLHVLKT